MNKSYRMALIEAVYSDLNPIPGYVSDDPLAKDAANVIARQRAEIERLRADLAAAKAECGRLRAEIERRERGRE